MTLYKLVKVEVRLKSLSEVQKSNLEGASSASLTPTFAGKKQNSFSFPYTSTSF